MTDKEQKKFAKDFVERWSGKGYEKGESQIFWIDLLQNVYGVDNISEFITFEEQVKLDHTSFIDGYIEATHVLIEQKSLGKDLRKGIPQSDGSFLTPYQQAVRYSAVLPYSRRPRWIITCNFSEFLIYDMEKPNSEPEQILLKDLSKEYYRLQFLVNTESEHIRKETDISLKAGEIVGKLYDKLLEQYENPQDSETLKYLNILCVRLVFCFYAEHSDVFSRLMFHDYLKNIPVNKWHRELKNLFKMLNTPIEDRDRYDDPELLAFPYVNGGLFADDNIIIPSFSKEIKQIILDSAGFDWSAISPTIFGAVFESTLNPDTRRSGGMHYTSIENIHKVIDPLFLDNLTAELEEIKALKTKKARENRLNEYRRKLAGLTFLDPACGSGNFLTETYLSLRKLENEAIKQLVVIDGQVYGQSMLSADLKPVMVSIGQFYGIEINDFAVSVAKTALWIAEHQMLKQTEEIMQISLDFLPLKSYANIVEGNSLRLDWSEVVPKEKLSYIMGNPPFVGHQMRSKSQINDMEIAFYDLTKHGKLDYVCCWYNKATDLMINTNIKTAFVSTNSIIQGEQVPILWKFLFEKGVEIQFAYQSFIWDSETTSKAHVHCVIIGFTAKKINSQKLLYSNGRLSKVNHINGYLIGADDLFIKSRGKCLTKGFPEMTKGSQPTDGGNLLLSSEEREELIKKEPISEKWIHRFMTSDDYINNKYRYCLWLVDVKATDLRKCPLIIKRLEKIRELRLKSPTKSVQKDAQTPYLFTQRRQPKESYMVIPRVSSEKRKYIPMGFLSPDIIASDRLQFISPCSLFMFGVLTSNVHMAWTKIVCGRLEMRYNYSPAVYNNFPFPEPTPEQVKKIELTAQGILDARNLYPDCSLADLYDPLTMPPELIKAHQKNDLAVMEAYGFDRKITESECVAELMKMYQKLTKEKK
ncbi:MAG: methylase [Ruminococcus sp.]|nr:methylase [Ruminococcus sp.]